MKRMTHQRTLALARPSVPEAALALITGIGVTALILGLGLGCGGRTLYGNTNTNTNQNNGNTNTNTNQNNNVAGECQSAADCVVATKVDACCSCPEAASPSDLANDPCLIPVGEDYPDGCYAECPAIPCPLCPTQGRTADCRDHQCVLKEGACIEDTECVAAIRMDNCCEQAFPATRADIAADPCLVEWPYYWEDVPQECYDAWDPICDMIDCAPSPPPYRSVQCSSDGCAFMEECADANDCTRLVDHRECCSCPTAWPASMVGHDPCLLPVGQTAPADCRPESCNDVLCEPCAEAPDMDCQNSQCVDIWYGAL